MKVLLVGNPNVGKSVVFSRLTGVDVIASNYPGTTIEFTSGSMKVGGESAELIDTPGAYSLEPRCKAEEVTARMLEEGDVVINVIDATNLERNLYLTLELLERKIPMIVALNMWDDTKHRGIEIDAEKLEERLGVPVVPTVAVTGEGIKELVSRIHEVKIPKIHKHSDEERWADIGRTIDEVQVVRHRHHTLLERIGDATVKPLTGIPIALLILFLTFQLIVAAGEFLIGSLLDPFFNGIYGPWVVGLFSGFPSDGIVYQLLIGRTTAGIPDFTESLGLLTTGLYIPLAVVLPFVLTFYLMLGLLEDVGYLPRLAVLVDNVMHRIGLHGSAIVPSLLGLGCNVPGALSTRILETKEQRFIALTLISIAVPCAAQQSMIFGILGKLGVEYILIVYGVLALLYVAVGYILNKILPGERPEILMEIPPYRRPDVEALLKKTMMRVRGFVTGAIPYVLFGVFVANLLYLLGIIDMLSSLLGPLFITWFGIPPDAIAALLIGFLRKDVAMGMLLPLGMTAKQLVISTVILSIYFPCIATFTVMLKELGVKKMLKSAGIMLLTVFIVGGLLNLTLPL